MKKYWFVIVVLVFVFVTRAFYLKSFAIGITHDELNYVIAAKSLFWARTFAPGTAPAVLPTSMLHSDVVIAEIPAMILSFLIGPLPLSLFAARLGGPLLAVFTGLAIYLLALELTKKKTVALVSLVLYAINPWANLMGRTIFEVNFFVAFYLWGTWLLIKNKGWRIFFALPFFLLGFFSYTGGQITFYLWTLVVLIYRLWLDKNGDSLKKYLLFMGVMTIALAGYLIIGLQNQSYVTRGQELYLPTSQTVVQKVDVERSLSATSFTNRLFINKYTIYFLGYWDKYINAFSVDRLFVNGELRAAFSLQKHGSFYFWEGLFMLVGLSWLFAHNKRNWLLVLGLILVSPITSGLNTVEYSYSQRAGLLYPLLIMLTGMGIYTVLDYFRSKKARYLFMIVIVSLYGLLFANLTHMYFFRFPVYASEGWFFQDRVLSRYLAINKQQVLVISSEPKILFQEYLFYNNLYNSSTIKLINANMNEGKYQYEKVVFTSQCPDFSDTNTTYILDSDITCQKMPDKAQALRITRLKDVYEKYLIFNDTLCKGEELDRYVLQTSYGNWNVEQQTQEYFCKSWITKL